jgi:hypothetical protein
VLAVCLATYAPRADLLERQLGSLDAQTVAFERVRVDGVAPAWTAFERALARARDIGAAAAAPCDQDDVWTPDHLEVLRDALDAGGATLAYGDARVVDAAGAVLHASPWLRRERTHDDLADLLATNSVQGAASLVRREVLDLALPFPPPAAGAWHDHWLACCARALGEVAWVDRVVLDHVQHGANLVGHARPRGPGERSSGRPWRERAAADRAAHLERPALWARTLLERADGRLGRRERLALERAARPTLAGLAVGALREARRPARTLEARRRALRARLLS